MRCPWCRHVWWNGHLDDGECLDPKNCMGSGPLREMMEPSGMADLGPPGDDTLAKWVGATRDAA